MRTTRNVAFLLVFGLAMLGGPQTQAASRDNCELTISGFGNCSDMENAIYFFVEAATQGNQELCEIDYPHQAFCASHGGSCSDYCYAVPFCNQDASACEPLWWDPEYCVQQGEDDWYCNCLCQYA